MRVLFVHPPHGYFDRHQAPVLTYSISRIPPLSGITMASYLRKNGHEVQVIDGGRMALKYGNVRAQTYEGIIDQARSFRPDFAAITVLTADFAESAITVRLLREEFPKAIIVAGGPHVSGEPEFTLRQIPELDGIGIGPGEDICLDIANGQAVKDVPGCAILQSGKVVYADKRRVGKDIDSIPFPAWELIDGEFYSELNRGTTFNILSRSLGVLSSRGCPFNCYFCSSKWNRPLRVHSAEYVLDYCEHLQKRYPIDTIAFWDDTIALDYDRLVEICNGFIGRGLPEQLRWSAMLRTDQADPGLLKLLREANCFYLGMASESGSDRVLQRLNKRTTVEMNEAALKMAREAGFVTSTSVMMGVPGETEDDMMRTIEYCRRLDCDSIGHGRFCPLPGSPSYAELVEEGKIAPEDADWERLGNFSLLEGPNFADVDHKRFMKLMHMLRRICVEKGHHYFMKNNSGKYPEIAKLYSKKRAAAGEQKRYVRRVLKRILPEKLTAAISRYC